jgi:hypothetical protein
MTAEGVRTQRRVGAAHGRHIGKMMTRELDAGELTELRDLCRKLIGADDE